MTKKSKWKLIVEPDDRFNFRFLIVLSLLLALVIFFGPVVSWIHKRIANPQIKDSCRFNEAAYADDIDTILKSDCSPVIQTNYYGSKKSETIDYDSQIRTEFLYESGKVSEELYYDTTVDSINPVAYATLHYYSNNQTIERIIRNEEERIIAIEIQEYDVRNHLLHDVLYEADETAGLQLTKDEEYTYENLKISSGICYDANENIIEEISYETDRWGRIITENHFKKEGNYTVSYTYNKVFGYDRIAVYTNGDGRITDVYGENLQ